MRLTTNRIVQSLLFVGLGLTVLYSFHTQPTSQVNRQKPQPWEIAFEQPFEVARPFSEGLAVIRTGGKYGYIDRTGQVVIEPQFDDAEDFSDGMACITINVEGRLHQPAMVRS